MAPVTVTGVPATLTAGDTLLFDVSFGDYPVSEGWTLSLSFVGAGQLQTQSGWITNDSAVTWTVAIPASVTATLNSKPGLYRWFAYMTGSGTYAGRRYVVAEGRIDIRANPSQATDGDFQHEYEVQLALVQARIAERLADAMKVMTIRGRQAVFEDLKDLRNEEASLKRKIWRLKNPGQAFPSVRMRYHGPG